MAVCGGVLESVTIKVKFEVPDTRGVPEILPLPAFSVSPVGRAPELMLHVTGSVAYAASTVALYATLTVPSPSEVVVIVKADLIVMLTCCVAVWLDESTTCTVKVEFCDVVGVPEITPVLASSESPAGRLPTVIDHE